MKTKNSEAFEFVDTSDKIIKFISFFCLDFVPGNRILLVSSVRPATFSVLLKISKIGNVTTCSKSSQVFTWKRQKNLTYSHQQIYVAGKEKIRQRKWKTTFSVKLFPVHWHKETGFMYFSFDLCILLVYTKLNTRSAYIR